MIRAVDEPANGSGAGLLVKIRLLQAVAVMEIFRTVWVSERIRSFWEQKPQLPFY
jgi:hypothetical protein